ncbi:maleylacetoacetate isomerase [uncultured Algimonas sp.]|uniref:maleylacetoacetate isomerase n=1 Tax=uncultured Algimonas sp. TaxID=1547920 RepID=UPI0026266274|nr:maleylacetoacetate isomerase [uncultured Algimonas sp.]
MKLHGYWRSSTSYRVRIALNLKSLDYDYAPVNLLKGEHRSEAYQAVNPHGTVPLLDTGDLQITQSLTAIDWLDRTYSQAPFVPDDPAMAALCRDLYFAVATELHAPNNMPVLTYLRSEFGADDAAVIAWQERWIHKTFTPIEQRLEATDWMGDLPFGTPSLFEIVLMPRLYNARRWKTNLEPFPLIRRIETICATLEPFQRAHPDTQIDAT